MFATRTASTKARRRLQLCALTAIVGLALAWLTGCPGELEDPDRFQTDGGTGGSSSTSGTGGSTSSSSSRTTSGTAGGGGAGTGGAGGG
jgi:hypothetical protein